MPDSEHRIVNRFRGFLPVVMDVETGGFNHATDALLEIAICPVLMDENGTLTPGECHSTHVIPFEGSRIDPKSLEITGIQLESPLRNAQPEADALRQVFQPVRKEVRATGCQRASIAMREDGRGMSARCFQFGAGIMNEF